MVSDFLKSRLKVHENLLIQYNKEMSTINIKILETEKFINVLMNSANLFCDDFSPYQSDNVDQKKIVELRTELHNAKNELVEIQHRINEENSLIEQYKSAIMEVKLLESK